MAVGDATGVAEVQALWELRCAAEHDWCLAVIPRKRVVLASLLPLNERWDVKLECGHRTTVPRGRRPSTVSCLPCGAEHASQKYRERIDASRTRKEETPPVHEESPRGNLESDGSKLGGLRSRS